MKQTNIFLRWICLAMLLGCAGVSWGQTYLTTAGGTLASGNYEIEKGKNLKISNPIVISSNADVTIDLNGLVLAGGEGLEYVIKVEKGGKLTIKDSNPELAHGGRLNEDAYYILDWVGENGTKPFKGGTIYNEYVDEKTDRKGIEVSGECIIERANIMGCYSKTYGAAVTVKDGGSFTMNGGEISYNCAVQNGGGIYSNGSLSIKNARIQYNKALGVDAPENASTKVNNGYGGGIYVSSSSEEVRCYIEGSEINHNYAAVFGGGIYSRVNTTIMNSKIQHNRAMHSEKVDDVVTWNAGRGGGFCFIGGGNGETAQKIEFVLDNTKVEYNACMYYGGGGHIATGAFLTQKNGTTINNNVAILHGAGGLHVTAGANFIFEDGEISNNVAHSVGGGIHSSYDCTLDLTGGTISHNTAHHRGGGVHVNTGGVLTLKGTNITANEVLNGKDYKYSTVTFNSDGSTSWDEPTSGSDEPYKQAGYGGGVLIDAGHCIMNSGELSNNKAEVGGGGLALVMINTDVDINKIDQLKVVQFTLNGGTIQGNTTEGQGAGIYLMENTMEKPTVDITGDGVEDVLDELLKGTPEAFIYGGTLTDNVAQGNGGALLVNGNVTMTDGTFTKNKADNGGGICIIGGTVDITKGNIIENEATNYGGGIYVENNDPKAVITLSGEGVFENNKARAGGGMAVKGPFTFNFAGTLQNNNAVNGGGIYLLKGTSTTKGATLHFKGGFIRNNTATGTPKLTGQTAYQKDVDAVAGVGGGVFMADYTTLDFNVEDNTLGFYGNRATNAADDIFANGCGTSVTLPDVKDMTLTDFSVPADNLFWAEDFYSHYENNAYESDSQYATLLSEAPSFTDPAHNLRYQFALQNLKKNHVIEVSAQTIKDRYVCLVLGYEIFYITIKKKGLKEGESAMFDISTTKSGVPNPYISMLLTGDENGEVCKRVALPQGTWMVREKTNWGWSYNLEGETSIENEVNADNIVFEFTNKKNVTETLHDEAIIPNKMGTSSSSNTDKSK